MTRLRNALSSLVGRREGEGVGEKEKEKRENFLAERFEFRYLLTRGCFSVAPHSCIFVLPFRVVPVQVLTLRRRDNAPSAAFCPARFSSVDTAVPMIYIVSRDLMLTVLPVRVPSRIFIRSIPAICICRFQRQFSMLHSRNMQFFLSAERRSPSALHCATNFVHVQ